MSPSISSNRTDLLRFHKRCAERYLHWYSSAHDAWVSRDQTASDRDCWGGWRLPSHKTDNNIQEFSHPSEQTPEDLCLWRDTLDDAEAPYLRWFSGGMINICFNEVDRHVLAGMGRETAFILEETGQPLNCLSERSSKICKKSYLDVLLDSCALLNSMRSLWNSDRELSGAESQLPPGSRVVLFGPNCYEQAAAVQACKRGAFVYTCVADTVSVEDADSSVLFERIKELGPAKVVVVFVDMTDSNLKKSGNAAALEVLVKVLKRFRKTTRVLLVPRGGRGAEGNRENSSSDNSSGSRVLEHLLRTAFGQTSGVRLQDISFVRQQIATSHVNCSWNLRFSSSAGQILRELCSNTEGLLNSTSDRRRDTDVVSALYNPALYLRPLPVEANFPCFITFTSGSTGKPKGVVHCHGGYAVGVMQSMHLVLGVKSLKVRKSHDLTPDIMLTLASPAWITGQSYMLSGALLTRTPSVLLEGSPVAPNTLRFAQAINRHRVTVFKAGSTFLRQVMQDEEAMRTLQQSQCQLCASLRIATFCAEPVSPSVHEFASKYICSNYLNSYWASEHGSIVFSSGSAVDRAGRAWGNILRSSDSVSTDVDCTKEKVMTDFDADDAALHISPGDVRAMPLPWISASVDTSTTSGDSESTESLGDLLLNVTAAPFPSLTRTLWGDGKGFQERMGGLIRGDPEVLRRWRGNLGEFKKKYFVGPGVDMASSLPIDSGDAEIRQIPKCAKDIYFLQGDSVSVSDTNQFTFRGRSDDVMNVGGVRVGSGEIESALLRHKQQFGYLNACVCAKTDEIKGQVPVAFLVVPKAESTSSFLSPQATLHLQALVQKETGTVLAVPAHFFCVEALPETITGKYMRRVLQKLADQGAHGCSFEALEATLGDLSMLRNPESVRKIWDSVRSNGSEKNGNRSGDAPLVEQLTGIFSDLLSDFLSSNAKSDSAEPKTTLLSNSVTVKPDSVLIRFGLDSLDLSAFRDRAIDVLSEHKLTVPGSFVKLFGHEGLETMSIIDMARRVAELNHDNVLNQGPNCAVDDSVTEKKVQKKFKAIAEFDCRGIQPSPFANSGGLAACQNGDLTHLKNLVHSKSDSASQNFTGPYPVLFMRDKKYESTALMWACSSGSLEIVRFLLEDASLWNEGGTSGSLRQEQRQAFVNAQNKDGRTALMFAAKYSQKQIFNYLLNDHGADLYVSSVDGSSVFDWAVYGATDTTNSDDLQLVKLVADRAPELVTRKNKFDCTCLHWAGNAGRTNVLEWIWDTWGHQSLSKLGDFGARRDFFLATNSAGHSALTKAVWGGHLETVRWLLNLSFIRDQLKELRDAEGLSILELGRLAGQTEVVKFLEGELSKS